MNRRSSTNSQLNFFLRTRAWEKLEVRMARHGSTELTTFDRAPSRFRMIDKPSASEYPAYARIYIDLLPDDGMILNHLEDNLKSTQTLLASLPEARLVHRYAEGKWTIKEILGHV